MELITLNDFCLSLAGAKKNYPWSEPQYEELATFTVEGKWFCLLDSKKMFIDIKCEPNSIPELQRKFEGAFPAWHMNKQHWVGIKLHSDMTDDEIKQLIEKSYQMVLHSLSKKEEQEIEN